MEKTLKVITQAIHLLIQVTNNYTMSYFYSQNDNHIFSVYILTCKHNLHLMKAIEICEESISRVGRSMKPYNASNISPYNYLYPVSA